MDNQNTSFIPDPQAETPRTVAEMDQKTFVPVTPTAPQMQWPEKKSKNKSFQILGGVIAILLLAGVAVGAYFVSNRVSSEQAIAPTAPESEPRASDCLEQCPGEDGILRNCTPPEQDGNSTDSFCTNTGRVEACGGKNYCCPSTGGTWTLDMTACPTSCVASTWTPDASTVCTGINVAQTSNCGTTRSTPGTKVCVTASPTETVTVAPTATPVVTESTAGACVEVILYGKTATGYSTTPMTAAEKTGLKIGDKIRIAVSGNKAILQASFRVLINDVVDPTGISTSPEWRVSTGYTDSSQVTAYYDDYEIKAAGNYKFEGQTSI